jgi:hypothetical protein
MTGCQIKPLQKKSDFQGSVCHSVGTDTAKPQMIPGRNSVRGIGTIKMNTVFFIFSRSKEVIVCPACPPFAINGNGNGRILFEKEKSYQQLRAAFCRPNDIGKLLRNPIQNVKRYEKMIQTLLFLMNENSYFDHTLQQICQ